MVIKKIILLVLLTGSLISLSAQNDAEKKLKDMVKSGKITDYKSDLSGNGDIIVKKNTLTGVLDNKLKVKVPVAYKEIELLEQNLFLVKRDSLQETYQTVYSSELKREIVPLMQEVALVSDDNNHKIIWDRLNKKVYPVDGTCFGNEDNVRYEYFQGSNTLLASREQEDYLVGFDLKKLTKAYGKIMFMNAEQYKLFSAFDRESGRNFIINDKGELLTNASFTFVELFSSGTYIFVGNNNRFGLLSASSGSLLLPLEYKYGDIERVNTGVSDCLVCKDNEWTYLDIEKNIIHFKVEAKKVESLYQMYAEIPLFLYVDMLGKYNLLDVTGNKILKEDYDDIRTCYVYYQYYELLKNSKYGMIDNKGNVLVPVEYDKIDFLDAPQDPKMILVKGDKTLKFDFNKLKKEYFDRSIQVSDFEKEALQAL